MSQFDGARVLITGAAGGLGRELALGSAKRGARLVLWDLNTEALDAVAAEVSEQGGVGCETAVCDVTSSSEVQREAERALQSGPIDIVINNAGIVHGRSLLELSDAQIEASFRVNSLAPFWVVRAFLPSMVSRGRGHLVTVASAAGLIGVSRLTDYSASKWAAVGLDESLRMELRDGASAIRTTVVCPYFIDTGMFRGVRTRFSFLLPILEKERVATRVLRAVEKDRSRLWLPPLVYTIPVLRMLPVRWFDAIATAFGINAAMDHFTGHSRRDSDPDSGDPA